jgi:hypothetical protein
MVEPGPFMTCQRAAWHSNSGTRTHFITLLHDGSPSEVGDAEDEQHSRVHPIPVLFHGQLVGSSNFVECRPFNGLGWWLWRHGYGHQSQAEHWLGLSQVGRWHHQQLSHGCRRKLRPAGSVFGTSPLRPITSYHPHARSTHRHIFSCDCLHHHPAGRAIPTSISHPSTVFC